MNHYLQVPGFLGTSTRQYLEKENIAYTEINDLEAPEDVPGIITFLGKDYTEGIRTFKIDQDANELKRIIEEKISNNTFFN